MTRTPFLLRCALVTAVGLSVAACTAGGGAPADAPADAPAAVPSSAAPSATPSAPALPQSAAPLPDDEMVWRYSAGSNRTISTVSTNGLTGADLVVGEKNVAASLSPDRRTIVYIRREADDRASLRAVSADGQSDTRLFADGSTDCPKLRRPAVGVNGTLAIVCSPFDEGGEDVLNIMNTDGTLVKQLDHGQLGDATFSPDGSRVVYARDPYLPYKLGGALFSAPTDGSSSPVRVLAGTNVNPVWSPTADEVAYVRLDGKRRSIGIVRVGADGRGGGTRALTTGSAYDQDPSWSPNGARLAFRRGADEPHLFIMKSDGSGATRVVRSSGAVNAPVWTAR
ncbi:TolB family protein [Microlunatus antarcticus]|uniref:Tol biopolymer transport system component n=1 Tax=Microlunatus antarcticus TaxID=53388 RepID=A0A7W5JSV8_9ACTN|nr:PD40 domain-containing protein [Microlunatus antarcticus]MBB3325097.1 Tol biopolymer transport system component [Microlunatus antarcticus]